MIYRSWSVWIRLKIHSFHIFNHLHQLGKQLILTSDKPPVDLQGMEERLITRLKWGLTAELSVRIWIYVKRY